MLSSFFLTLFLALFGLVICTLLECYVRPRPCFRRPLAAWGIHIGICFFVYGFMVLILARPYFAFVILLASVFILVFASNAKLRNLREPLTAHDYKSITNIFQHPRLFLPYVGKRKLLLVFWLFILTLIAFFSEPAFSRNLTWTNQGGAILLILSSATLCLAFAYVHTVQKPAKVMQPHLCPAKDIHTFGLLTTMWLHAFALRQKPDIQNSPFVHCNKNILQTLPHLIAIQSESFFDPRRIFANVRTDVLSMYDTFCQESIYYGSLQVPAFGANTMRTEFAFLTGITDKDLGAHRFNPYILASTGFYFPSFFHILKTLGYEIVVVHPHIKEFFNRHKVFAHFGVDSFLDEQHFSNSVHYGPYVGDVAVAETIMEILQKAKKPTCIFAITMENHGPLHLEQIEQGDINSLYSTPPPQNYENLTVYLRHICQADKMLTLLHNSLQNSKHPASLCWYGDHKPIMPKIYDALPSITPDTDYFFWNNPELENMRNTSLNKSIEKQISLQSHELASYWLTHSLWK